MQKTDNSKSHNSKRRLSVVAVLVLAVAVICGGGLWWHCTAVQEHDQAFASYRTAVKTYKVQEGEYRKYLASDEVTSASAVTDEQVSDAKTVQTLAKSVQTVKPASSRSTGAKTGLTGDASTSELGKAAEALNAQTSDLKSKLKALKADVLAVTTSKAHKLLSDAIGNGDKILADSDGKVPDGDQTRNNLAKALESSKNVLNDKKSVVKALADAKAELDARVKAVNDAVSAKAQADARASQAAANASSNVGGGYSDPAHRSGNGYSTPSHNGGGNYRAPSGGGSTTAPKGGNDSWHPTWLGTTDGSSGEAHWEGDHHIVEQEF